MVTWLLSLFAAHRCVVEALHASNTEKLVMQDRLDSVLNDRRELWRMMESAIVNERAAYQMQINSAWQKQGFGAPYPEAPMLPSAAIQQPGGGTAGSPRPEMPSSRVTRATAQFVNEVLAEHGRRP